MQHLIGWQTDGILVAFGFEKLIEFWVVSA